MKIKSLEDRLKESIIKEVKSLLKTEDSFTKEEVDYLLACMYDRMRVINKSFLEMSIKILQDIVSFSNHLCLFEKKEELRE